MAAGPTSYRTPLSRARGLGPSRTGVGSFLTERITSIALVPLGLWGVFAALRVGQLGWAGVVEWLGNPLNATLLVLLVAVSFQHMHVGMRVIIEDYIHKHTTKLALLLLNAGVCLLFAALAVFSILKVAFSISLGGGGAV